jgi:hypothetical protein
MCCLHTLVFGNRAHVSISSMREKSAVHATHQVCNTAYSSSQHVHKYGYYEHHAVLLGINVVRALSVDTQSSIC